MSQVSTEKKEPGNRLGAVGLLAMVVGAGGLAFEVPPRLLVMDARLSWSFVAIGLLLLGAGLLHEWQGPRRWSAILPAVLGLGFGGWAVGASADESLLRCERADVRLADLGSVGWTCQSPEPVRAIALMVETPWARGVPALARGLAERGIMPVSVEPMAWIENPPHVLVATAAFARAKSGDVPLGILSWGETARDLPTFVDLVDADFGVALSMLSLEPIDDLTDLDAPTLFAYGVMDDSYPGHGHAGALLDALGSNKIEGAAIRVFLGADRDLLVPVERPSIQPTRLATGWLDLLSDWILTNTATVRSTRRSPSDRPSVAPPRHE